jgi:hypothetical protein
MFFKIKNPSQNISTNFFQWAFDENVPIIHVFIKQIFRAAEKEPPSPVLCRRWGSNGYFQPEAVSFFMALKQ